MGSGTPEGFYAIAGCAAPSKTSNPMCGATTTYVHINMEAWSGGYVSLLAEMKAEMPSMAPKSLGSMGYGGRVSVYLPQRIQEAAYTADAEALEYFRSYNASRKSPWRYFSSPRDIETSRLLPCGETTLMDSARMREYAEITGDTEGVVVKGDITQGRCFDSFFWYSPACRQEPATCVVVFTGGTGWALHEWMQKATAHNMPVALAVGSGWGNYTSLFLDYPSLTYWWEPDPTFLAVDPVRVVFPPADPAAWLRGDVSTDAVDVEISKQVSQDLSRLAPDVEAMLSNFNINLNTMKALLLEQLESQDGWPEVACRWLQANEPTWRRWIPDNSECSAGYGMFNEQEERFVSSRADPSSIRCKPCLAGHASEVLLDDAGTTHVCTQCVPGTHQAVGFSLTCDPCPAGEYQDEPGGATCKRCPIGWYQDVVGQKACKACPESSTTVGLGSLSISECGCKPNTINVLKSVTSFQCAACGRGLSCPLSSSITTLREGQASLGEDFTPKLVTGFFSTAEEPLSIWECRPKSMCPGGKPGDCRGLEGLPCARCPDGQTLIDGSCQDCRAGAFVPVLVVVPLGLAALVGAYYLLNNPVTTRASPFVAVLLSAGFAVNILQVVAIFGMMTLQWSSEFEATSGALQIFMLDLQTFSPSCILGANPVRVFLLRCLIFPALVLWLLICYFASPLWGRAWNIHRVCNSAGTFFAAGFGTMSAVAMQPLMCYQHPNGKYSLLKHPDVRCGGAQHSSMLPGAEELLLEALGFGCLWKHATEVSDWVNPWSARPCLLHHVLLCCPPHASLESAGELLPTSQSIPSRSHAWPSKFCYWM